ncbi:MAG: M20/M25/M40 family metallo-hydrolase [Elusimicrobia bacterium]|nr:M20/M25/M40 family metallo-hydrolase [Elusimicrobiota bacterium]
MKKTTALLPLLFLSLRASAQPAADKTVRYSPPLTEELTRLREAALASDYGYRRLAHLSHNIGPRLSGSPQAAKAVEYVAAEMRALGAEVSLERLMVPHWVRGAETAELVEYAGQAAGSTQKILVTALGGSAATQADGLTAEVAVVCSMDELRKLGKGKIQGKIVLFDVKFDKSMAEAGYSGDAYHQAVFYRAAGASAAARLGAAASLVRSVGSADFRLPHTGAVNYSSETARIPAGAVAAEDAEMISDLASQGPVKMRLVLTPQTLPDVASANVVADLRGTEHPEQIVLVSGHLDSWDLGTGSIDDGAGVAMAMQTLQLIKRLGLKPKRTVRLVAWMNEENGNRGGETYARDHNDGLMNQILAIESDNGAGHALGFMAHMKPEALAMLKPLSELLAPIGAGIAKHSEEPVEVDITPLQELGVPGAMPLNDRRAYFHYHHTAADTLDKVVPRELQENSAVMSTLAWAAANLPDVLPR